MLKWLRSIDWLAINSSALLLVLSLQVLSFFASSDNSQEKHAQYSADEEQNDLLLGIGAEGWTAIFTGFLTFSTIGLWISTYAAARDTRGGQRIIERAYLSPDFNRAIIQESRGVECRVLMHNGGKTPADVTEYYGEFSNGQLPAVIAYENDLWRTKINVTVPANRTEEVGTISLQNAPELPDILFGYVKYIDVFGDEHTTRFAILMNFQTAFATRTGGNEWNKSD